jgi:hypothetical protein
VVRWDRSDQDRMGLAGWLAGVDWRLLRYLFSFLSA